MSDRGRRKTEEEKDWRYGATLGVAGPAEPSGLTMIDFVLPWVKGYILTPSQSLIMFR